MVKHTLSDWTALMVKEDCLLVLEEGKREADRPLGETNNALESGGVVKLDLRWVAMGDEVAAICLICSN